MIGQSLILLTSVAIAALFSAVLPSLLPRRIRIPVRSAPRSS